MSSQFDPSMYLDATITEASTRRPPLPVGRELLGTITEVKVIPGQSTDKKTGELRSFVRVEIPIEFDLSTDAELAKIQGTTKVTLTDSLFLDLVQGSGAIDMAPGKNNKLRRYREALDMNTAGQTFSFRMMNGRPIRARIKHEPYEGEVYDKIDAVAKV